MKAVCWYGKHDIRVVNAPDPKILNPRDVIVRVTLTALCGSDLHVFDGHVPMMHEGDILGHEFMGEVVEIGSRDGVLSVGDRVVVPFAIACGSCSFCRSSLWSLCDNSNPNAAMAVKFFGSSPAGLFGYSHLFGGYAGGQAEFVRVPYADVGAFRVPAGLTDEQVLFLSDTFPTAYMAVENGGVRPGDTVAIWGAGPIGQLAAKSAYLLGAERVVVIDRLSEHLRMARELWGAQVINYDKVDVVDVLRDISRGRGPDVCVNCVEMEAHGTDLEAWYDRIKQVTHLESDRSHALRQAIYVCRKGGTVSIPGVYGGSLDKMPMGAAFAKGLTLRMGQTHVHKYMWPLCQRIERGEIDPSRIITHRLTLDEAPKAYQMLRDKEDECVKIVMRPS